MSAAICVQLDPTSVRVTSRDGTLDRVVSWSPDAPDAMADALRPLVGTPSSIVMVIGLGLLEVAQPDLPPLDPDARRALLWRDADRYFPVDEPIAVLCADAFAFGVPARLLRSWMQALGGLGRVRTVVTAPQVAASIVNNGAFIVPAGVDERGLVTVSNGRLTGVRRVPLAAADDSAPSRTKETAAATADLAAMGREAARWTNAPLTAQLLDASLARQLRRERQQRWVVSGATAVASLVLLLWSAGRWRDAELRALDAVAVELGERAQPAMRAEARRARAQSELALLATAADAQHAPDAPLAVLSQLTRVLPRDAFVQRLEWDGALWRVDGTADNARRLVPLLDGDARFQDVRIATASQRFLDEGRQRESFAITFRMRPGAGDGHGTP